MRRAGQRESEGPGARGSRHAQWRRYSREVSYVVVGAAARENGAMPLPLCHVIWPSAIVCRLQRARAAAVISMARRDNGQQHKIDAALI